MNDKVTHMSVFRAARDKKLSEKLAQDIGLPGFTVDSSIAWLHTCPMINTTGYIPKGESCVFCRACEPKGEE